MHDCQRFREELTDRILGGTLPDPREKISHELNSCEGCSAFYADARAIIKIVDASAVRPPELPGEYWTDFSRRLRLRLTEPACPASLIKTTHRRK